MTALEIHTVKLCPSERLASLALERLDPHERERAARFHFFEHRAKFSIARSVLRILIARLAGVLPAEVRFEYGPNGKPALCRPLDWLCFNSSHSGDYATYVFASRRAVGIDIEQHRQIKDMTSIAARFFHARECEQLLALPASAQQAAFYNIWARKEAYIKATGLGLALPLAEFQVPLESPLPVGASFEKWRSDKQNWRMLEPPPLLGYSQAIVYEAGPELPVVLHPCVTGDSVLLGA